MFYAFKKLQRPKMEFLQTYKNQSFNLVQKEKENFAKIIRKNKSEINYESELVRGISSII